MTTFFWTIDSTEAQVENQDRLEEILEEWRFKQDESTIHYTGETIYFAECDKMNAAWGLIYDPNENRVEIDNLLSAIAETLAEPLTITIQCTRGQVNIYQRILNPDGTLEHNSIAQP